MLLHIQHTYLPLLLDETKVMGYICMEDVNINCVVFFWNDRQ